MRTMIISVPEEREQWFRTLFDQFKISHRTWSEEEGEDFRLSELIGEAMTEEGETTKEEVMQFIKNHGGTV